MNLLTFTQSFSFGVKRFKAFRKHLLTDPKKLGRHKHTNPHAIPFKQKQQLLNVIPSQQSPKRAETGKRFVRLRGKAQLPLEDSQNMRDRLPVYDIPNIEGFQLSPYVQYLAPKVKVELLGHQKRVNENKILEMKQSKSSSGKGEDRKVIASK